MSLARAQHIPDNNDNKTVNASNCTSHQANAMMVAPTHAVVDTGATVIFIMEGMPVHNKRLAKEPIFISLPDGRKVKQSHTCNVSILGLPFVLTGHIVPDMTMASLLGIRVLCKTGCEVIITDKRVL